MKVPLQTLLSLKLLTFAALQLLFPSFACAVEKGDTLKVTLHGTLKRKPCHISNDKIIEVAFGNVGVKKVDGQRYIQPIDYQLECESPDDAATLKMTIKGTQTLYNTGAITTNVSGLGIKVLQNGSAIVINQPFIIDYRHPPVLQAVPVTSGQALTEGVFSATATLLAEYE
ncbi:fimbrial protein [Pantoea sp. NSTU24]|uniref:fimbrial protein n=1 Tax=Pantoea sp. NSTU24 TaxID=3391144 RepID=UPI003D03A35B